MKYFFVVFFLSLPNSVSAIACGGWQFNDHSAQSLSVSFLAESMRISGPGHRSQKSIRPNGKMVFFRNGDRAYYLKEAIVYWERLPGAKKKFRKTRIGTENGLDFELDGVGKFKIALREDGKSSKEEGAWAVEVLDASEKVIGSARLGNFCGESEESAKKQARRIIAYYIWKTRKPNLDREVPNWWAL